MVVLPAYNAGRTLERTIDEIPPGIVDDLLLVDDASGDDTVEVAKRLGIRFVVHPENRGYGGLRKYWYGEALVRGADVGVMLHPASQCSAKLIGARAWLAESVGVHVLRGADIVLMLHPDYQYSPKLIGAMAWLAASDEFDVILGSRILGRGALQGGMPRYKYCFNRILTAVENVLLGLKLSEYHTGYRTFTRKVIETLPLGECSDDFVFDNQMLAQTASFGFRIGEISCPTRYFPEASSINFRRSVVYGLGVLATSVRFRLHRMGLRRDRLFNPNGAKLRNAIS